MFWVVRVRVREEEEEASSKQAWSFPPLQIVSLSLWLYVRVWVCVTFQWMLSPPFQQFIELGESTWSMFLWRQMGSQISGKPHVVLDYWDSNWSTKKERKMTTEGMYCEETCGDTLLIKHNFKHQNNSGQRRACMSVSRQSGQSEHLLGLKTIFPTRSFFFTIFLKGQWKLWSWVALAVSYSSFTVSMVYTSGGRQRN